MRARILGLSLALSACASSAPPTDAATEFAALQALEQRVAAVSYRLTTANTELCAERGPQTGMTLHDARQYAPADRAAAVRYFQMIDAPSVMAIAPGSPADRAGLKAGDVITAVNNQPLHSPEPVAGAASYEGVARTWSLIHAELARGPVTLTTPRGGEAVRLRLDPEPGCFWQAQLVPSPSMTASADGRVVSLTTALARYAARDDDLAVVIGHEMAHNLLQHRANPTGSQRDRERAADRVGLHLAARAGYDISGASDFWRRFGDDSWSARLGILTHPSPSARSQALAAVAAEIEAKRAAGLPLRPD